MRLLVSFANARAFVKMHLGDVACLRDADAGDRGVRHVRPLVAMTVLALLLGAPALGAQQDAAADVTEPVAAEAVYYLTEGRATRIPTPPTMKNHGNFVCSLSEAVRWLGEQATALGINIFPCPLAHRRNRSNSNPDQEDVRRREVPVPRERRCSPD